MTEEGSHTTKGNKMDRDDMPNQIAVEIIDGSQIVFSRLSEFFETKGVVYNADRPLNKEELEAILAVGGLELNDMRITDKYETPAIPADKAKQIAEFVSNQIRTRGIPELVGVTNWEFHTTHEKYMGIKEVRLSLVVTP